MKALLELLRTFIFRGLLHERSRAILTIAGVALGVAVFVAIRLANRSALDSFQTGLESVSGQTSLEVGDPSGTLDETVLSDLLWLGDFGTWSPVIERFALLPDGGTGPGGEPTGEYLQCFGVDLLADWPIRDYRILETAADEDEAGALQALELLREPDAVVIPQLLADRLGIGIGETFSVLTDDREVTLRVRGLLRDEGPAKSYGGNFVLLDIAAAQSVFDCYGRIDRVDVMLNDQWGAADAAEALAARLPSPLVAQDPGDRFRQAETMVASFHFNLAALASLALVVGLFLIYNTASFSVVRRRREIGRLRAVGTSRKTVFTLFVGEAALLALPGVLIGCLLGRWLASAAVGATASTVQLFFIAEAASESAAELSLRTTDWLLAFGVAFPLCLAAAAFPALEATRIPPADSTRDLTGKPIAGRELRNRFLVAAALAAAAVGLCFLDPPGDVPVWATAAVGCVIAAAAFLVPVLLRGACHLAKILFGRNRHFGTEASLASSNLSAATRRVSVSVAALALALGMTIAVGILIGSFRKTVVYWLEQSLAGDIFVRPAAAATVLRDGKISLAAIDKIRQDPAVDSVELLSRRQLPYGDAKIIAGSGRFAHVAERSQFNLKAPNIDVSELLATADPSRDILVSESFAIRYDKPPGSTVTLPTKEGTASFNVLGVYYDYSNSRGVVLLDRSAWETHFSNSTDDVGSLVIFLDEDADAEEVRRRLETSLSSDHRLVFNTTEGVFQTSLEIFDSTFTITRALQIIAVTVAALGVVTTLVTLLLERLREIAMVRLLGAAGKQIRRIVVFEAAFLGLVAQVLGIIIGIVFSLILIFVINVQSFGWTIQVHFPWLWIVQSTVLVIAGTALAGLWPAVRAVRVPATRAI